MDKQEPKKVLTEEDIFNQKDIDAVTDYINKEQQKQHLIDMMKSDEELGLYDDIEINRIEVVCKDCNKSLEDCTCLEDTIELPNQALKEAAERYIAGDNYNRYYDDFLKQETLEEASYNYAKDKINRTSHLIGFREGAKWLQEQSYSDEKLYSEIEWLIISWNNDGTKTAGHLTRQIIEQFKKK